MQTKNDARDPLEQTIELFDFLQGEIPDGYHLKESEIPKLSKDQAWTVVEYLGNLRWQVPDCIERCDVCGHLYNSDCGGSFGDEGPLYYFCDHHWYEAECQRDDNEN